jgi:hypothetical protein
MYVREIARTSDLALRTVQRGAGKIDEDRFGDESNEWI